MGSAERHVSKACKRLRVPHSGRCGKKLRPEVVSADRLARDNLTPQYGPTMGLHMESLSTAHSNKGPEIMAGSSTDCADRRNSLIRMILNFGP